MWFEWFACEGPNIGQAKSKSGRTQSRLARTLRPKLRGDDVAVVVVVVVVVALAALATAALAVDAAMTRAQSAPP